MEVYSYMKLIPAKNAPILIVEEADYWRFSRFDARLAHKAVILVIFLLVLLVEKNMSNEVERVRGALLFDEWSCADRY